MTIEENHTEIWNYLKEIKVGMLTTSSENHELQSRPMFLVQEEYEGVIWLFAHRDAHKIEEVENHSFVNLNFANTAKGNFVTLSGKAKVEKGGSQFDALWSDDVKVWFSESENPKEDAVLIRIDVDRAEVWDSDKGTLTKAVKLTKAKMTGERPKLGENKVLEQ
ncbi:MAG: pyridoxamine 5'-phosphate oxidase family protein [Cryomorphaceae bacterium]